MPVRLVKWPIVVLTVTGSTSNPITHVISREIKPQLWIFCFTSSLEEWIISPPSPWPTKFLFSAIITTPECIIKQLASTFAVEVSRKFTGNVRSVVPHALDDSNIIIFWFFKWSKWCLSTLLMMEIGFDPESVYHIVELVWKKQSALQP